MPWWCKTNPNASGSSLAPQSGHATTIVVFFAYLLIGEDPNRHQHLIINKFIFCSTGSAKKRKADEMEEIPEAGTSKEADSGTSDGSGSTPPPAPNDPFLQAALAEYTKVLVKSGKMSRVEATEANVIKRAKVDAGYEEGTKKEPNEEPKNDDSKNEPRMETIKEEEEEEMDADGETEESAEPAEPTSRPGPRHPFFMEAFNQYTKILKNKGKFSKKQNIITERDVKIQAVEDAEGYLYLGKKFDSSNQTSIHSDKIRRDKSSSPDRDLSD